MNESNIAIGECYTLSHSLTDLRAAEDRQTHWLDFERVNIVIYEMPWYVSTLVFFCGISITNKLNSLGVWHVCSVYMRRPEASRVYRLRLHCSFPFILCPSFYCIAWYVCMYVKLHATQSRVWNVPQCMVCTRRYTNEWPATVCYVLSAFHIVGIHRGLKWIHCILRCLCHTLCIVCIWLYECAQSETENG